MPSALLVLAATAAIHVAIPSFEVVRAPGILSDRLALFYAMSLSEAKCAQGIAPNAMGPQATGMLADCHGNIQCLGGIGKVLGADFVLHGVVGRTDPSSLLIKLTLFDIHQYQVVKNLELRYTGRLSELEGAIRKQSQELCAVVNPAWKQTVAIDTLAAVGFEAPATTAPPATTSAGKTASPPASSESLFADLPMVDPSPPPPASATTVSSPVAPASAPVAAVASPHPAPPVVAVTPVAEAPKPVRVSTPAAPAPVATPRPLPPVAALKVVPPSRPVPWAAIAGGGAVALFGTGVGFGVASHAVWSQDKVRMVQGMQMHSITHSAALRGNRDAAIADVLFGVAAAAGVGAGVLVYLHGGLGVGGHF